jgi:uncharacterized delta-60 repeat protein
MGNRAITRWSAALAVVLGTTLVAPAAVALPGELVTTFGPEGSGAVRRAANAAVLVQPDGKVVTVGGFGATAEIARQSTTGHLDPSFGTNGTAHVTIPGGGFARAAALQTDGKIVIVADAPMFHGNVDFFVTRLTANGAIDRAFGTNGSSTTDVDTFSADVPTDVAIAPDGKIVVAGQANGALAVVRYTAAGKLDPNFADGGALLTTTALSDPARVVALGTGKIVVAGSTDLGARMLLERYNTGGTLDHSFGVNGRADPASTAISSVNALVVDGTDLVVGGDVDANASAAVARFDANGHIDATFGTGGTASLSGSQAATTINDLAVDTSGRIVATGASTLAPEFIDTRGFVDLFRFTAAGQLDSTFGCRGVVADEVLGRDLRSARGTAVAVAGRSILVGVAAQRVRASGPPELVPMLMRFANESPAGGPGLTLLRADGGTSAFGNAPACVPVVGLSVAPLVGIAADRRGRGTWTVAADGGVFRSGSVRFYGSMANATLASPIVGIAAMPSGHGYWLAAADGGVFAFGAAHFLGSMGAVRLHSPVVGIAPAPDGRGYWLVAADGGVFAFGSARFFGSMGAVRLHSPVVGIAPADNGGGYLLAAADGGVFAFGSARFEGSLGAVRLVSPVVGIAPDSDGRGYWLAAADGGVFAFAAPFIGSTASAHLSAAPQTTVGIAAPAR